MKGTWNRVSTIMKRHGFKAQKGITPLGLERTIREMLNEAYCQGYSDGGRK